MRRLISHSYILAFFAGFFSLSLEILGTEVTFSFFARTSEAMALALSAFLLGLALGSWLTQKYNREFLTRYDAIMCGVFLAIAIFAGPVFGNFDLLQLQMLSKAKNSAALNAIFAALCFINLFLPAILIGLIFPLANDKNNKPTGKVNFSDLLGAVVGAVLAGFVMVPYLGLGKSFFTLSIASLVVGLLLLQWSRFIWLIAAAATSVLVVGAMLWAGQAGKLLVFPAGYKVLSQENSSFGVVSVVELLEAQLNQRMLYINYRPMCISSQSGSESEEKLASLLANEKQGEGESVLNIGLGCGMTAAQILKSFPKAKLEIAEINDKVVQANQNFFADSNGHVLKDPRVTLHSMDGYKFLRETKAETFNRILIDIEEPTILQSSALYTEEGFQLAKEKLKPGGVFGLWSLYQAETAKIILNTLRKVYRYAEVYPESSYLIFFASDNPLPKWAERNAQAVQNIEAIPLNLIATIKNNPYPIYYDVNKVMNLDPTFHEPNEIKK